MLFWIYGSGFPKSLDVSKAIDKTAGAEREVIGTRQKSIGAAGQWSVADGGWQDPKKANPNGTRVVEYTAPATPEAQQWQGWGTALKPAHEPIIIARKPLTENETMTDRRTITIPDATVFHGSCLDVLKELPDNSIDSIVTDPPYGLSNTDPKHVAEALARWGSGERDFIPEGKGFMGKAWDAFVPPPAVWDECLRVLKPGGHLLAFAGSRTFDLMALSIRLAGFEIRDSVAWLYGSGFPKSLDVSKAIDKQRDDVTDIVQVTTWLRAACEELGWNRRRLCEAWGVKNEPIQQWTDANPKRATVPTWENWQKLKALVGFSDDMDAEVWRLNGRKGQPGEAWQNAEVIGVKSGAMAGWNMDGTTKFVDREEKAPATDAAKQWQGWGTALKPAFEPIVVARKPLIGTVAENVLAYGTGGLNIDGTRIGTREHKPQFRPASASGPSNGGVAYVDREGRDASYTQGRWPANVMLDEYTAALLDEQSGIQKDGTATSRSGHCNGYDGGWKAQDKPAGYGGIGGASRFFYVAKASKRDRNEGLDELEATVVGSFAENVANAGNKIGANPEKPNQPGKNFHPTVKPTDLMRQLVRLVTPPGGTVLDPFTGSGSTGKAAILEGFQFIGVELTEEYLPIIEGRLQHAAATVAKQAAEQADVESEVLF